MRYHNVLCSLVVIATNIRSPCYIFYATTYKHKSTPYIYAKTIYFVKGN